MGHIHRLTNLLIKDLTSPTVITNSILEIYLLKNCEELQKVLTFFHQNMATFLGTLDLKNKKHGNSTKKRFSNSYMKLGKVRKAEL